MKEIKFRAWDKIANIMRYDLNLYNISILANSISNQIFMQWTGFHDINKKEIYNGDIVKCNNIYLLPIKVFSHNFIVSWVDDGWAITNNDEYICGLWTYVYNHRCEVIGNIYEVK